MRTDGALRDGVVITSRAPHTYICVQLKHHIVHCTSWKIPGKFQGCSENPFNCRPLDHLLNLLLDLLLDLLRDLLLDLLQDLLPDPQLDLLIDLLLDLLPDLLLDLLLDLACVGVQRCSLAARWVRWGEAQRLRAGREGAVSEGLPGGVRRSCLQAAVLW